MRKEMISGFADEICAPFEEQLKTVSGLGMKYLCIRAADGRSITEFSVEEAESYIKPMLEKYGLKVSSLGSPIGKIPVDDEDAFTMQLSQLDTLCRIANVLDCRYIRLFSFYTPKNADPEPYFDTVVAKLRKFIAVCDKYGVVPVHENEKAIYGETGARCLKLYKALEGTSLVAAYDFANFVQCDQDPVECYKMVRPYIGYMHIKDAKAEDHTNVLCATGDGHIPEIMADLQKTGYDGFMTLEPHLRHFKSLAALEANVSEETVKNWYPDGAAAFTAQYNALCAVLDGIL